MPIGHALQEYVIEGLVGEGGFGIVYLARDTRLGRNVALKEYMPANLATRGANHTVSVRSERHRETFDLGLRSFVNEAQLLASFDHPSLVKVYRFWEANGTAYMVMPFYQGPTLKKWLPNWASRRTKRWLLALLAPMIDALEQFTTTTATTATSRPTTSCCSRRKARRPAPGPPRCARCCSTSARRGA